MLNFKFLNPHIYSHLEHIYAIATYEKNKKMVTTPAPSLDGIVTWNKSFPNLSISLSPATLKIKLYNKQRSQILDLFLG